MKLTVNQKKKESGTIITVIMCTLLIAGILLGSYFTMVQNQSASVARTQAWNSAISVSEAGVEEAFSLINRVLPGSGTSGWEWTNSVQLVKDGWTVMSTNNSTTITRTNGSAGSYTVKVTVPTSGTNFNPVIESTAVVPHTVYPWVFAGAANASVGAPTVNLTRKVQVSTTRGWLFPGSIASVEDIKLAGGSTVDSFDSANTNYSTGGYYDPTKARDKASVNTDATVSKSIAGGGNIKIKGTVATGPGGTTSMSGNASVGDSAWVSAGNDGIQAGHGKDDMNVQFLNVYVPTNLSYLPPVSASVGGTNVTLLAVSGAAYVMDKINLNSDDKVLITGSDVTLWVKGDIKTSASSVIQLAPGASVKVYVEGSVSLGGQGVINPGYAKDFQVYGTPTSTSFTYSGGSDFTGTIYAPQADIKVSGGASFIGAIVSKSYTSSGTGNFHYDEDLGKGGPVGPFVAYAWSEIK